jgi:hypothetical protein
VLQMNLLEDILYKLPAIWIKSTGPVPKALHASQLKNSSTAAPSISLEVIPFNSSIQTIHFSGIINMQYHLSNKPILNNCCAYVYMENEIVYFFAF